MFFLILLVMFLGALGFGYVQQTENTKLITERNEARAERDLLRNKDLLVEHYVFDIGKVIGKFGPYEGRPGMAQIYNGATMSYPNLMNPDEVKKVMDDGATAAGVSTATSLENLLGAMVTRINALADRAKQAEDARDKAMNDQRTTDGKLADAGREASRKTNELSQNLEQTRTDFEAAKGQKDNNINTLTESLRSKADELAAAKEAAQAREKELQGQIALLKTQNSALVEREALRKSPDVPDGKILVAKQGLPTAFINLGRKDMLQPGTVFRVTSHNGTAVKGYCQVTRVEDERAEVRLYDFVDPIGDFAREGDRLFNDFYTPRVTRTIYLMGRFGAPYSREQLSNLLTRLGNRVVNKMVPGVDTVILGNDPVNEESDGLTPVQDSEEFKLANELRVEFTYLPKIIDLLKL
ncbi:MAG: hypothetical protein H6835_00390 [Planctomycetes bacterium]|nr:hypothetical protein [Planctomycetota bacterium]